MKLLRAIRTWFRVVLPHSYVLSVIVIVYLLTEMVQVIHRVPLRWGWLPVHNDAGGMLLVVLTMLYGFYRVLHFHPFYRADYREWLQLTPWRPGLRLPQGPIHLMPQDLILLGVFGAGVMRAPGVNSSGFIPAFLIPYLLSMALALTFTGPRWAAFLIVAGIGGFVRFLDQPAVAAGVLFGCYALAWLGLRLSLRRFHDWELGWWDEQGLTRLENLSEITRRKMLGWPFEQLSLKLPQVEMPLVRGVALSLLGGWWAHALLYHAFKEGAGPGGFLQVTYLMILGYPAMGFVLGRLIVYTQGYAAPLSLWGRIFTGRLIIPGYDQVLMAPLAMIVVIASGTQTLASLNVPPHYGAPLLLTAVSIIALTMKPSLREWRLTGHHRVTPIAGSQKKELVETR